MGYTFQSFNFRGRPPGMAGFLLVRGGVHIVAYARALEKPSPSSSTSSRGETGRLSWSRQSLHRTRIVDRPSRGGYIEDMKTAVSIPDDLFEEADRLAVEMQTSLSQLYSRALQEIIARPAPDRLTEAMNRVVDEVGFGIDKLSQRASRRALGPVE